MTIDNSTFRQQIIQNLTESNGMRMSRYKHAIYEDAIYLVEEMDDSDIEAIAQQKPDEYDLIKKICLNGAKNTRQWSYSGLGLISNYDIAEHYCTPSEFKKRNEGDWAPRQGMTWLDLQAVAMTEAMFRVWVAVRNVKIYNRAQDRTAA